MSSSNLFRFFVFVINPYNHIKTMLMGLRYEWREEGKGGKGETGKGQGRRT